jgi:HAD superfamily hydrolase (TIGR01509 family)
VTAPDTAATAAAPHAASSIPSAAFDAVLWDLDGTIVDTERHWMVAGDEILAEHLPDYGGGALDDMHGWALPDSARRMHELGVPLDVDAIVADHVRRVEEVLAGDGLDWRPGARELLALLRAADIPLALVTMSYRSVAELILASLPPATFAVVVTGDDVMHGKPAPDAYLLAAERLGVDPTRTVAIEDSVTGATAARAAGATTVGVPSALGSEALPAHAVWESLAGRTPADLVGVVTARSARTTPDTDSGGAK